MSLNYVIELRRVPSMKLALSPLANGRYLNREENIPRLRWSYIYYALSMMCSEYLVAHSRNTYEVPHAINRSTNWALNF